MGNIYVDESIHDRAGFIVLAAVYAPEPLDNEVDAALSACGFEPGTDEYKSSMSMDGKPDAQKLRERLQLLLIERCHIAVAICALAERPQLMDLTFALIERLTIDPSEMSGTINFDQGIEAARNSPPTGWLVRLACDSRKVAGIQLADCAAHTVATMLLSVMGIVKKKIPAGNSEPLSKVELDWELWTSIRYALSSDQPIGDYDEDGLCEPTMLPFGLLISENCPASVRETAERYLSAVWVGCIQ